VPHSGDTQSAIAAQDKKEANSKSNFKNYFQQNRLALDLNLKNSSI
jgi:hypothetical protein